MHNHSSQEIVAHYNLAATLGRTVEAVTEYRKALALDADRAYSSVVHYNLGIIYNEDGKLEEAIREFEQSIACIDKLKANKDSLTKRSK